MVVVFAVELVAPLLFFGKRRLRLIACWATVGFQILILLTGNYGFFNLLAIVLCLMLLDDAAIRSMFRRNNKITEIPGSARLKWPCWLTVPLACVLVPLSFAPALMQVRRPDLSQPGSQVRGYQLASLIRSTATAFSPT